MFFLVDLLKIVYILVRSMNDTYESVVHLVVGLGLKLHVASD